MVHLEVGAAISICRALLQTVLFAKELWDQRDGNNEVAEELTVFIRDLQVNLTALDAKQLASNNTSTWSMAALKEDLEKANQGAQNILQCGFLKKLWDSKKIREELRVLRERVMTSFQVKLLFTTLDVTLDNSKNQKEFLAAMSRVQQELNRTHAETSAANLREIKNVIRRELQQMWQPVQTEMRAKGQSVEGAIGVIKGAGFQAQTDDTEKFFADVLMELENARRDSLPASGRSTSGGGPGEGGSSTKGKADLGLIKWYHDPITWDIMCDPVKASDGRTYDRWTLLNNSSSMKRSPFDPGQEQPLKVEFDDISVRSQLFHKFPEQEEKCKTRRREYREEATRKADEGLVGDALVMLNHVLDWAGEDGECRAKRDEMQGLVNNLKDLMAQDAANSDLKSPGMSSAPPTDSGREGTGGVGHGDGRELEESLMVVNFRSCDGEKVAISKDNLTVTSLTDSAVCFQTTLPCPPGCSFYFEMKVKDAGAKGRIAIGFSTGTDFTPDRLPGLYPGSWAYHGDVGAVANAASSRVVKQREVVCSGDTVGAGLLHRSRLIYFIHNGTLLRAVTVDDSSIDLAWLYPTFGLHDQHAKVTLNFGGRDFMSQDMPTRLDQESCVKEALEGFISISGQGMEARFMRGERVVAVRADRPVPCRLPSYYFELKVKDVGQRGWRSIGFTGGSQAFRTHRMPGWDKNTVGYHGDDGGFFIGFPIKRSGPGPTFTAGDTVGAGIFYDTDEIFYRKNGVLVGTFSRRDLLQGDLPFPTIGLKLPGECVRLNFGETPFMPEVLPSELNLPTQPPRGALAVQADRCVPVETDFYFELELTTPSGMLQPDIAIGFTNKCKDVHDYRQQNPFRDDKLPGVYAGSCGYHQDGSLYYGGRHQSEQDAFGAGDTVGAGVLRRRGTRFIFFTRNGKCIASVDYLAVFSSLQVYPTIGMTPFDKQAFRTHFFDDVASMASRIPQGIPSPTRRLPSIPVPVVTSLSLAARLSPMKPNRLLFRCLKLVSS